MPSKKPKVNIYDLVTDRIIDSLEKGTVPWAKPWTGGGLPMNLITKKAYQGINVFLTSLQNFTSPYWLTFKQAKDLNGTVKKGEKSTPIVFWNFTEKEDENGNMKSVGFLRYYTIFNVEQTEGVKYPTAKEHADFVDLVDCEKITENMPDVPEMIFGGHRASYNVSTDVIHLPNKTTFKSSAAFYSVKYHELAHSTGAEKRLNRPELTETGGMFMGGDNYSKEELTAEIAASFLTAITGIGEKVIDNSAAYIAGWLKQLRNDKKMVISAAGKAQKAVDYILDRKVS